MELNRATCHFSFIITLKGKEIPGELNMATVFPCLQIRNLTYTLQGLCAISFYRMIFPTDFVCFLL